MPNVIMNLLKLAYFHVVNNQHKEQNTNCHKNIFQIEKNIKSKMLNYKTVFYSSFRMNDS